jgi:acetyltransferase
MLDVLESFEYLKKLPIQDFLVVNSEIDLKKTSEKFGFPVFLKISSSEHKLKLGGVKRCENERELKENYSFLIKRFSEKKIIAQKAISGKEIILGIKSDSVFGKLIMVGTGGSDAEKEKDVSFRAFPIEKKDIENMINEIKISRTFDEKTQNSLVEIMQKLTQLNIEKIKEMDINPLIINRNEMKIVDARIEIQ